MTLATSAGEVAAIWQVLGIVLAAAVVAGAGLFFQWMKHHVAEPLQQVPILVADHGAMLTAIDSIDTRLKGVESEFKNNDGHTLRDSADRNEAFTKEIAERIGINTNDTDLAQADSTIGLKMPRGGQTLQ